MGEIHEDVVQRAEARVGSVLCGKYLLDSLLGVGGMAAVYAATHRNGNRVAVKMLHTALSTEADLRKRFLREGYVANAVEHPGVVRVLDDDVAEDGSIFLVMDLVVGASAETVAEWHGGRVAAEVVTSMCHQLLDVVAAAHANGVIHRDIKPDNICVTREGVVKLLDFGVARMRDTATATREGTTIGTPAFMSPEQALGKVKEIDQLSDVYAVGAVMFTMLSGRFVHEGESANELLIFAATRRARSLAEVVDDVPSPIVDVVDRALVFEKSLRWPNAAAMRDALSQAHQEAFGRPMLEGAPLAAVLDGIESVDLALSGEGDDWPTLLSEGASTSDEALEELLPIDDEDGGGGGRDDRRETAKWSRETPGPHMLSGVGTSPFAESERAERATRLRRRVLVAVITGATLLGMLLLVLLMGRGPVEGAGSARVALSGLGPAASAVAPKPDPGVDAGDTPTPQNSSEVAAIGANSTAVDVYALPRVPGTRIPPGASGGTAAPSSGGAHVPRPPLPGTPGGDKTYDPFAHQ